MVESIAEVADLVDDTIRLGEFVVATDNAISVNGKDFDSIELRFKDGRCGQLKHHKKYGEKTGYYRWSLIDHVDSSIHTLGEGIVPTMSLGMDCITHSITQWEMWESRKASEVGAMQALYEVMAKSEDVEAAKALRERLVILFPDIPDIPDRKDATLKPSGPDARKCIDLSACSYPDCKCGLVDNRAVFGSPVDVDGIGGAL